jgi:creatinine amidohydrolase
MLHLHPSLVRTREARNFPSTALAIERENRVLRAEGAVSFGWQTQDLNVEGACGDATQGNAAVGAILVKRAAEALATLVTEVARYPLARLRG